MKTHDPVESTHSQPLVFRPAYKTILAASDQCNRAFAQLVQNFLFYSHNLGYLHLGSGQQHF